MASNHPDMALVQLFLATEADLRATLQRSLQESQAAAQQPRSTMTMRECNATLGKPIAHDAKCGAACPICLTDGAEEPVRKTWRRMPCCGQQVMYMCARKWLLKHATCPFCRHNFAPPEATPAPTAHVAMQAAPVDDGDARAPPRHLRVLETRTSATGADIIVVQALGRRTQV